MEVRKKEIWRENGLNPDKYSQSVGEAMQQYANEFHQTEINKLNKSDAISSVADYVGRNCPFCGEPCVECSHKATDR